MKKIVEEAISRAKKESQKKAKSTLKRYANDKEIDEVLKSLTTKIKVIGCGGAGSNTIARCVEENISGAELIAVNTDAQHLLITNAPHKILIGKHLTHGLGAGSVPKIGEEAAVESE